MRRRRLVPRPGRAIQELDYGRRGSGYVFGAFVPATGAALARAAMDKIAFTGSATTGRKVAIACAERSIPCSLELGGSDPALVLDDADPELPFVLAAGLRTHFTANTIQRDPGWRKGKGARCALSIHPDDARRLGVRANADNAEDAARARRFGAAGIGLCRTEHMFLGERRQLVEDLVLAQSDEDRDAALGALLLSLDGGDAASYTISQGVEMGRPSLLKVTARRAEDGFRSRVGGSCAPMFRGEALL